MSFYDYDEIDIELAKQLQHEQKEQKFETIETKEEVVYKLQNEWKLWYGRWDDPKQVMTFNTINEFWGLFNNIKAPTLLNAKMDYHMFLNGVAPNSEDENNRQGGSLSIECSLEDTDKYWLYSCLALIGNTFAHSSNINGLMINVRPKFARIQMWVRNVQDTEVIKHIAGEWKKFVQAPKKQQIKFTTHEQIFLHNDTKPKLVF